jgi:dTDP-4-dehydrorhamnose 3,5-epimerase
VSDLFPRIEQGALRLADDRGHIDILYESGSCVLKRTFSKAGVFRGLHWQAQSSPQVKIFRVVSGRIADVIVAMDDPARTPHVTDIIPADGWVRIDAGFAHGFYAHEDSVFEYFCDGGYDESAELGFNIAARLPALLGVIHITLSPKDAAAPPLAAAA